MVARELGLDSVDLLLDPHVLRIVEHLVEELLLVELGGFLLPDSSKEIVHQVLVGGAQICN